MASINHRFQPHSAIFFSYDPTEMLPSPLHTDCFFIHSTLQTTQQTKFFLPSGLSWTPKYYFLIQSLTFMLNLQECSSSLPSRFFLSEFIRVFFFLFLPIIVLSFIFKTIFLHLHPFNHFSFSFH